MLASVNLFPAGLPKPDIEKKLEQVVSQPKFNYIEHKEPPVEIDSGFLKWLKDMLQSISEFWSELFKKLGNLSTAFLVIVIVLVGGIVIFLVTWAIRNMNFSKKTKKLDDAAAPEELNLDYQLEVARGKRLMSEGRLKEAVDMFLNAVWLYLSGKSELPYDKARTDRECLSRLKGVEYYPNLEKIVRQSEIAVFYKENLETEECGEILGKVETFLSK
ncbi:MAG: hypothetical protein A2Y33_06755 [Spirochaetes bacterium GWF1_51_8]|nr:MAG: hypothetical protein A2Y33_06755 [Spirochaetes bacterium GWF1_51_8]